MNIKALGLTLIKKQKVLIATIILFIISALVSPVFLTPMNLSNLLLQISTYGIVSIGVMFVMLTGEFDVSVGSILAFSGIYTVMLTNRAGYVVTLLTLLPLAFIMGSIYGILVDKIKFNSFVATLGGMYFYRGMGYVLCGAEPVTNKVDVYAWIGTTEFLGINCISWIFLFGIVLSWFVITRTTFGRNIMATGGNYEVAKASGIRASYYKFAVYIICDFCALLAGMLLASRLSRAVPNAGDDASMSAISSVVIGGTSMKGGEGGAFQTLLGVFLIGLISNILNILGVMAYLQQIIKGAILIIIVCFDRFYRNRAL